MTVPARNDARLGTDLALTRASGVESAVALVEADTWGSLDLAGGPRRGGNRVRDRGVDLQTIGGRENLAQGLILRLLTPQGDLAHLGHPDFGSRLGELIGRLNNEATRNLARLYTIEAIAREPRVSRLDQLDVRVAADRPDVVEISFRVRPVTDDEPVSIALEVAL
jgi:phage baseplate assembly protein W